MRLTLLLSFLATSWALKEGLVKENYRYLTYDEMRDKIYKLRD